jgi:hypothetical protein
VTRLRNLPRHSVSAEIRQGKSLSLPSSRLSRACGLAVAAVMRGCASRTSSSRPYPATETGRDVGQFASNIIAVECHELFRGGYAHATTWARLIGTEVQRVERAVATIQSRRRRRATGLARGFNKTALRPSVVGTFC